MHRYAYVIDHDDAGREYVHGEVLMTARPEELYAASQAGFTLISTAPLGSLGAELARVRIPEDMSIERAMAVLQEIAPHATLTSNDIYRHSQSFVASPSTSSGRPSVPRLVGTLGIIDTGVDVSALPVSNALLTQRAFAGPQPTPRQHGSIVASLAISHGMRVHVADVFSEAADGSIAASAESIAAALDWMIDNNIPVINVSIEGPNNAVLQQLVRTAAQRGHVVVAAAGNGGPMARPAYPAAFEGAVAVTAIDERGNPYLRANRGAYIAFAAPGVDVDVDAGDSHVQVSGTSFAAPIVAAHVAEHLHSPSRTQEQRALEALRTQAVDLGAPGRDPIYGWGAVRSD